MLSFIRKRLPSKDRSNDHLQNVKSNRIKHTHQDDDDDEIKRTQSTNELNLNTNDNKKKKKKKQKQRSLSTFDELVLPSNNSPPVQQINKSYSDVDYFPMMPGALSYSINQNKTLENHNSFSDCYYNPWETVQPISNNNNNNNYIQSTVIKPREFQIPVNDCRKEQFIRKYNDVDHERTKALREVTEQRTQQRSIK